MINLWNELYNHNVVKKKVKRKETFISLSLAQWNLWENFFYLSLMKLNQFHGPMFYIWYNYTGPRNVKKKNEFFIHINFYYFDYDNHCIYWIFDDRCLIDWLKIVKKKLWLWWCSCSICCCCCSRFWPTSVKLK